LSHFQCPATSGTEGAIPGVLGRSDTPARRRRPAHQRRAPLLTPGRATAASPDGRLFATVQQSEPSYQIKVWGNRSRTQLASH